MATEYLKLIPDELVIEEFTYRDFFNVPNEVKDLQYDFVKTTIWPPKAYADLAAYLTGVYDKQKKGWTEIFAFLNNEPISRMILFLQQVPERGFEGGKDFIWQQYPSQARFMHRIEYFKSCLILRKYLCDQNMVDSFRVFVLLKPNPQNLRQLYPSCYLERAGNRTTAKKEIVKKYPRQGIAVMRITSFATDYVGEAYRDDLLNWRPPDPNEGI